MSKSPDNPNPNHHHVPLLPEDLGRVVGRLPEGYKIHLMAGRGILAGGFIRSVIAGEPVRDVDVYCSKLNSTWWHTAAKVADVAEFPLGKTIQHVGVSVPLQLITAFPEQSEDPAKLLDIFDFTICKAVVWYDVKGKEWKGLCDIKFYLDLASKRLRYEAPPEHKYAGGSLLRMRKYVKRGYHIPASSLAQLVCDVVGVDILAEKEYHKRLELLSTRLVELDPSEGGTL